MALTHPLQTLRMLALWLVAWSALGASVASAAVVAPGAPPSALEDRLRASPCALVVGHAPTGSDVRGEGVAIARAGEAKNAKACALAWQAHLYDADAGLILARARVIDPVTGVYLQRDPELFTDSVNLYALNANDPINQRDPTGEIVDVTNLSIDQRRTLITELSKITGRPVVAHSYQEGKLELRFRQGSTRTGGSAHAHRILDAAIRDRSSVVSVSAGALGGKLGTATRMTHKEADFERLAGSGSIVIDFDDLARLSAPKAINSFPGRSRRGVEAHGLGYLFFHELIHTFGFRDPDDKFAGTTGETVDEVNKILRQRGLPTRKQYAGSIGVSLPADGEPRALCFQEYVEIVDGKRFLYRVATGGEQCED